MLQFAVQSFTYTDNLNKAAGAGVRAEGWGGGKKKQKKNREKEFRPKKSDVRLRFLLRRVITVTLKGKKKGRLPYTHFGSDAFHGSAKQKEHPPPLSPLPYPRKISTPDVEASQLRRKI